MSEKITCTRANNGYKLLYKLLEDIYKEVSISKFFRRGDYASGTPRLRALRWTRTTSYHDAFSFLLGETLQRAHLHPLTNRDVCVQCFPTFASQAKCGQTHGGPDGRTSEPTPIPPPQLFREGDTKFVEGPLYPPPYSTHLDTLTYKGTHHKFKMCAIPLSCLLRIGVCVCNWSKYTM